MADEIGNPINIDPIKPKPPTFKVEIASVMDVGNPNATTDEEIVCTIKHFQTVKDIDGNDVQIPSDIEHACINDLEGQRAELEAELAEIDEKENEIYNAIAASKNIAG